MFLAMSPPESRIMVPMCPSSASSLNLYGPRWQPPVIGAIPFIT